MKHYGFIYITTNLLNKKQYLGMCAYHRRNHSTYLGSGKAIKRAIKKYGNQNFSRKIIKLCETKEDMVRAEMELILLYNCVNDLSWYNLNAGGFSTKGFSGKTHTDESKNKIRKNYKRPINDGTIKKFHENGKNRIAHLQDYMKKNYKKHPSAITIKVDGVIYQSIMECSLKTNCNYTTLRQRLNNPKFTNAIIL